ncbi:hypothetical protein SERLA73DRAFT_162168 [Serpula lacrymans var. lacrymans S7.3]|uniref:Cerato-platanin n=2 Tax=Serpula lacrymans var. lacrymans TaxID=341189 RepID=F8Q6S6_SERL3|nr:uncharacterized protein SERLADRAFT_417271 [Serpula lacrymans var. lacrymans S7.9]EGN96314.1 hypothetical protein SERLA73DRAFT_162168 [Serpula lacrymans var. lacrymans S7.3]EGO21851.1 hypothetical protein SERLADRAFT_417271 [Serpula lacrymans var. lacrymans S7.9]
MMFMSVIATLVAFVIPALTQDTVSVSYDTVYDNGFTSLSTVACSGGVYGLDTKGYTTFSSLPDFPYIGGAPNITGGDSPSCGTCWELNYSAGSINETIYVTAVDAGQDGFNLSLEAMNALTNNLAQQLGRISATATQVSNSSCGF